MPANELNCLNEKLKKILQLFLLILSKRAVLKLSDEITPTQREGGIIKTIYFFKKLFSFVSEQAATEKFGAHELLNIADDEEKIK